MKIYKTIFYETYSFKEVVSKVDNLYNNLKEDGNLFILTDNVEVEGRLEALPLKISEYLTRYGFKYNNIIVCPFGGNDSKLLKNTVRYVLWFSKSHSEMFFDKDKIREKHIWKDVEWGKRAKNYNPKGKDPGNVWLPTEDNGKAVITKHIIFSKEDIIKRCLDCTTVEQDEVLIKSDLKKVDFEHNLNLDFEYGEFPKGILRRYENLVISESDAENKRELSGKVIFKSSEKMTDLASESVDLMVTSPPYWDLKNYFKENQIGYKETYEEYLNRINCVWKETYRVLKEDGSMWINISIRVKNKEPLFIPYDIIKQCEEIGFNLVDIIMWHKSSGIPTHKNNIVSRYEFFIWFSKSEVIKYNKAYEDEINEYKNDKLRGGNIWNINRKAGSVGKNFIHPAIYPEKLVERIINLCSNEGDLVLDPFLGSGTSMIASLSNNRSCVGYEFNEGFKDLMTHRFENEKIDLDLVKFENFQNNDKKLEIMR